MAASAERHVLWMAAWGALTAVAAAVFANYAVARSTGEVALWPILASGAVMVAGLYLVFSPLLEWWPFRRPRLPKQAEEDASLDPATASLPEVLEELRIPPGTPTPLQRALHDVGREMADYQRERESKEIADALRIMNGLPRRKSSED